LRKNDISYQHMFGYMQGKLPGKTSNDRTSAKDAIEWLMTRHKKFAEYFSICESVLKECDGNPTMLFSDIKLAEDSYTGNRDDLLGDENAGLWIPGDDIRLEDDIELQDFPCGIQERRTIHPSEPPGLQQAREVLQRFIRPHYGNPDLEAMAWPVDFPAGEGSYNPNSTLSIMDWIKMRLLNLDQRFRRNRQMMFFEVDRMFKERIAYYNRARASVTTDENDNPITVGDIKKDEAKTNYERKFGDRVPINIRGSRGHAKRFVFIHFI
jgi:hypothetical protein